ncbi:nucleotide-binding universal stress UspA family protein [Paraburkholderia bannensis]|uniref:Nucleotide-binding universal stress UspA family protein n=1 Tax=Paraburkholderia bannensis TaxID=765414 RepID=A0A7W9WWJ7_9BURK|nr:MULTISPECIES: universal stress protein [Paraburkholderia]MBB3261634.1 nucleotide-binding universal stress UspA family protein [Paraburkholderia sp. WP4_3_2]MBB6106631.1 nucleotide-binding universal stress UspA family protein [Paraburkholderia bannensis]
MLKVLIPVLGDKAATEAARHGALLFAERCAAEVEIVEVLDDLAQGRAVAFHSLGTLRRQGKQAARNALMQTRAILEDAGVPYTWSRVYGPTAQTIAQYAAKHRADIVLLDGSRLGFIRRWAVAIGLWRLSSTPVTMLH